ncbi:ferric-dicitrate binding protein FerR (iron transport regulator) [Dyadobacter sp. BE34]|uniref:Ferric-dicitrate binding protein FerR (Iron transport regulator) n=1 Tax=Dyadobacter fermentans TaxID=94254 RepID=A0ABU1R2K0_9BACT|nr:MULTISPECIES: FecR domain-containing protein [Dyadobacter]MDR6807616.1 ferric-dicitrate binding protein FerR (iron transport regulator) [Dyadobacter fermentans]MDR7045357.1 ferric-dicitrate binding protein FerR (iron transport regulator) [Dyadobacter sp. BE242]MDR7199670.1 ferric-dicitrate binding protein FerR (iron transport regulator) [Dyadobacter sp. BE34]MDR7217871.1 ferric-dicitrate binding protein FerR (iron transport regulator) [Dyadobacter sp. BE31]MDR7265561.1 ferric-dicitrate bind
MTNDQVYELIARKLSGEATPDELKALDLHLKNEPELAHQAELLDLYFYQPASVKADTDEKSRAWENLRSKLNSEFPDEYPVKPLASKSVRPAIFIQYRSWIAAAASVLLIVSLAVFYSGWRSRHGVSASLAISKKAFIELKTEKGTRLNKVLPDGTKVWLNGDSYLSYNADFGKSKRDITLVGEAFFDVAHNTRVPLTVHAKDVNILVTGTAFNVKSYSGNNKVETALLRGSVEVSRQSQPEQVVKLKPNEKITINIDDPASASSHEVLPIGKATERNGASSVKYQIEGLKESSIANMIPEVSWVENVLLFDNEPFGEVIDKMEKWYNVDIQVQNQELMSRRFSGVFKDENIIQAVEALQIIIPLQFEQHGKTIIIR